jgi:hypothetical protein
MTARTNDDRSAACPCGSGLPYRRCCELLLSGRAVEDPGSHRAAPRQEEEEEEEESREARLAHEALWDTFEALPAPTTAQMGEHLGRLLALPHELTSWGDLLRDFESHGHPDIGGVYRRIAAEVRIPGSTELAFFLWAAAELFARSGPRDLLPEVAARFARLDASTYDADGLAHIEDHLLAAGFDAEALALSERYLPITRAGVEAGSLTPYVKPFSCALIFQLRVGLALAAPPDTPAGRLATALRRDVEDEIDLEAAEHAARVICERGSTRVFRRQDFRLPGGDIAVSDAAWHTSLSLHDSLMRVAREAWQEERISPGYGVRGLCRLLESVHGAREDEPVPRDNLLDYLDAPGLEDRVVESCADILGTNESQARVLLDAHALLLRFAERHCLVGAGQTQRTREELTRLLAVLEASG